MGRGDYGTTSLHSNLCNLKPFSNELFLFIRYFFVLRTFTLMIANSNLSQVYTDLFPYYEKMHSTTRLSLDDVTFCLMSPEEKRDEMNEKDGDLAFKRDEWKVNEKKKRW